jgi:UDP-N-acetylmuramyl pentapeptide phosphotransferase/UDP-N-acetylglucosamine-1-phosphate transferase
MTPQFAAAITSFTVAFLALPVIIKYSLQRNLVDIPGRRKIHKKVTPSMGGIAIFAGFFVSCFIWINWESLKSVKLIMVAMMAMFFLGLRDDMLSLRASAKLLIQTLVAMMVIFVFDFRIDHLNHFLGINEIPLLISYVLTYLVIIIITNSFNLIDGLDGLAGMTAVISLSAYGIWFLLAGDVIFSVFAFALLGGTSAFLFFNWQPSKIFMGDTGTLVIGMMLSILSIRFLNFNERMDMQSGIRFYAPIAAVIAFNIVALTDTVRIIIIRLLKGISPFTADKRHIHHALIRLGWTHQKAVITLACIQICFLFLVVVLRSFSEYVLLPLVLVIATLLSVALDRILLKRLSGKENSPK